MRARNTCVYVYMRVYDVRTTCVYAYALFFESLAGLLFSFLDVLGQQESTLPPPPPSPPLSLLPPTDQIKMSSFKSNS